MRARPPRRARRLVVLLGLLSCAAALAAASGAAAPTNDNFASAQPLSGSTGSVAGSNVGATQESGEPLQGRGGGHTVWYSWTAPASGSTTFDTMGSALDTVVSVYTGTRVDRLALVATDDDGAGGSASRVTFTATSGVVYRIQVDGVFTSTGSFTLTLNRKPPPNDNFAAAQAIGGASGSVGGTTAIATVETGEPSPPGSAVKYTVWYRWTAPSTGQFWFQPQDVDAVYPYAAVWSGSGLTTLKSLAVGTTYAKGLFSAVAGQSYAIQVSGGGGYWWEGQGRFTLTWGQATPPANDNFASAQAVSGLSGSATSTTWAATAEPGEPDHAFAPPLSSVWFRYTATASAEISFDASGSDYGTRLAVYRGSSLTTLARVPGDWDSWNDAYAWYVRAGDVLWIALDRAKDRVGAPVTLTWRTMPPLGDAFADGLGFGGLSGTGTGSTAGATKEPGEPNHAGNAGGASLWFHWGRSVPGTLTLDTTGSSFATLLAAYTGDSVSALTPVTSGTSTITLRVDDRANYVIALDGVDGAYGDYVLHWRFAPDAPANDNFASAQTISQEKGHIDGRTAGATAEAGEPAHAGVAAARSVWYRWVAPADGRVEFDTFTWRIDEWTWGPDTTFDSRIAVYRGSALSSLTLVAANDDWAGARVSRVSFPTHAGLDYWIAVDVARGDPGSFSLGWNLGPVNDDFAAPTILSGPSGSVDGTNEHATWEGTDGGDISDRDANGNVWYLWKAPASGTVSFRVQGSSPNPDVDVGTGPNVALLQWLPVVRSADGNTYTVTWNAVAGTVYRIEVESDGWGPFVLSWGPGTLPSPATRPANDAFAAAQTISGPSGSITGDNTNATIEAGEPAPADAEDGCFATVWYRWTAPATGTYTFDTAGSTAGTVLAVYGGTSVANLYEVGSDGLLYSPVTGATVRVGANAGDTFSILVGSPTTVSYAGAFKLEWAPTTAAPPNDELANAQTLGGASGSVSGSNASGSRELGEPDHAGTIGGASVWYRWTAPASGNVSFQTATPSLDTALAVYSSGAEIASNHVAIAGAGTYRSRVVFTAQSGATYTIAVDSTGVRYDCACGTGSFTLSWSQPPTPPNDNFASAADLGTGWSAFDDQDASFGATKEAGEPSHAGVAGGASVWFKWQPTSLYRTVTVSTRGSDFDTVVAVYTGSSLTSLTPLAADDDSGGGGTSHASFVVDGSGPYWIAVDGKNAAQGHIVLSLGVSTTPANDHLENAMPLTTASGSVSGAIADATRDPGQPEPNPFECCRSVWFRWTAPVSGTWRFDLDGTSADATIGIYTGTTMTTLVRVVEGTVWNSTVYAPVVAGRTYTIMVIGEEVSTDNYLGLYTLNWRQATAPANDVYASALTLSGSSGSVTQSNAEASVEAAEPYVAGSVGGASLWYRWTAPASGTVSFDTAGSGFDDVLGVYTGSSLATLQPVAQDDDFAGDATSYLRLHVTAGTTYSIGVDGSRFNVDDDLPVGTVKLAWTFAAPPGNDAFASAQAISGTSGTVGGTTAGATTEAGEPPPGDHTSGASVWYSWTAPATGNYRLDTSSSATPVAVGVYSGSSVASLTVVRRSDDLGFRTTTFAFAATAGTTYRIAVDGDARAAGPFTLSWSSTAPANDAFANAQQISGSNGTTQAATVGATKETGEPNHAGVAGGASVWFRWTAPASGLFAVDTVGSDYDTLLAVYTGAGVGALTQVAASDDADGKTTSAVRFEAVAGTTYRIALDGKSGATGNATLDWRPAPQPANDDFAAAELIGGRQGTVATTTLGGTREAGEPDHDAAGGAHSVWYRYRAPGDGTATFTVSNNEFATAVGVYTGTSVSALTTVAQGTTSVSFAVAKDASYLVAVDGVAGAAGAFQLSWRVPPANDAFAAAQAISGSSGSVDGTTEGATAEATDGSDANSVWYRWTAPATGTFVFSVPALEYPPAVGVGVGSTFASRAAGGTWQEPGRIGVTQGVSYWIEVQPNSWTQRVGPFTLTWKQATDAPPNDSVPNAQAIGGASGSVGGSSVGASREPGEPNNGYGTGRSVWFRWTAPASGMLSVTTLGSSYSNYLAAYTGSTVANLAPVTLASHVTTGGWPGYDNISFSVTAGTSYLLDVDSDGYGSYRMAWSLDSTGAGSGVWNDMFANAQVLTDTNGSVNATNVGATKEAGEPNHAGNAGGHSVWYAWTAPASQPAGFQTPCALDTLLAVYTGTSVSALTQVGANDNASSSCVGSVLSFNAVKGVTYRIAVDGKNGATGSFTLQWTGQTVDVAAPTTVIAAGPSGVVSSRDASFSFTSETGATFACSLDGAAFAACTSPVSYTGLALGTHTFSVRATDAAGNTENPPMSRTWTIAAAPGNDAFAAAAALSGAVGAVDGSLVGATRESGDPFASDAETVWYAWTAPRSGVAQIGAPGADVDAFTGSSLGSLVAVPRLPSTEYPVPLRFNAVAGTTYRVVVAGNGPLAFRLSWTLQPPNDDVASPVVLSGSTGTWSGDNVGATGGATDPAPIGERGGASIWFRWTAPATGTLKLDTSGSASGLDTILAAYTLSPFNDAGYQSLVLRGADDGSAGSGKSLLSLSVYEGTDYLIAVDGIRGATGAIGLAWSLTAGVAASPPAVALTSPADGAHVGGTVVLTASASDPDGITQVDFLVNGVVVGTDRTEPYSVAWSTTTLPDGNETVTARATDATSATTVSPARTLVVDNTPPDTTITGGPSGTVSSTSASFTFTSSEGGSAFRCSLDGGAFGACTSPKSYSGLAGGQHSFQVAAVDAAGNVDPSPASQTWTISGPVDTSGGLLSNGSFEGTTSGWSIWNGTLTLAGDGKVGSQAGKLTLTTADRFGIIASPMPVSTTAAATYTANGWFRSDTGGRSVCLRIREWSGGVVLALKEQCVAETSSWQAFPTVSYTATAGHQLDVVVVVYNAVAGDSFEVDGLTLTQGPIDTTPPDTTITGGPSGTVTATSASFSFSSSESGSSFQCQLDGSSWTACTSPKSYSGLASGQHTFQVKATDPAGNTDPTPATQTWTISAATGTPPPNDAFAGAQALSGPSGSSSGNTTYATRGSGEPQILGNAGGHSVWFSWTASANGTISIDTSGSSFDTALAAYTGTAVGSLTRVADSNDVSASDHTSSVGFAVTAGTTYSIQLDGWNGTTQPSWYGAYTLHWTFTAATTTTPAPSGTTATTSTGGADSGSTSTDTGGATGTTSDTTGDASGATATSPSSGTTDGTSTGGVDGGSTSPTTDGGSGTTGDASGATTTTSSSETTAGTSTAGGTDTTTGDTTSEPTAPTADSSTTATADPAPTATPASAP